MDQEGGSLHNVRYHVQGDLNICAFNVTSQMIDAARYSSGDFDTSHVSSPLALAIQRFSLPPVETDKRSSRPSNPRFFFEYNTNVCWDFNALKNAGVGTCNEANYIQGLNAAIPEKSFWEKATDRTGFYNSLRKIERYTNELEKRNPSSATRVGENPFYLSTSLSKALQDLGGNEGLKKRTAAICNTSNSESIDAYSCESELVSIGTDFIDHQDYALRLLHRRLSHENPVPQALSICHESLVNKKKNSLKYSKYSGLLSGCTTHVVLAAGRRQGANGQCQILLRNSQNQKCRNYAFPENCESSENYWIDEDHLLGNIIDIAQIRKSH